MGGYSSFGSSSSYGGSNLGGNARDSSRDSGSDGGNSRSSRSGRNNDPDHPAYSPSGESAGSLNKGGWSEYNSGDNEAGRGYKSTTDRMNDHLSRYGSDDGYTRAFNSFRDTGFGRSAISNSVSAIKSNLSSSKTTSLAGSPDENTRGLLASPQEINEPKDVRKDVAEEYIESDIFGKVNGADFGKYYDNAMATAAQNLRTTTAGNLVGSVAAGALPSVGNKIADMALGLGLSKAGTIHGGLTHQTPTSQAQKDIQDYANRQVKQAYDDAAWDDWTDYARAIGRVALGVVTLGASEIGAGLINGAIDREQGLQAVADKYGQFGNIAQQHQQDLQARTQSAKDRAEMKALDDSNPGYGILSSMRDRQNLAKNNSSTKYNEVSYGIPALANLWDNLQVIKG